MLSSRKLNLLNLITQLIVQLNLHKHHKLYGVIKNLYTTLQSLAAQRNSFQSTIKDAIKSVIFTQTPSNRKCSSVFWPHICARSADQMYTYTE